MKLTGLEREVLGRIARGEGAHINPHCVGTRTVSQALGRLRRKGLLDRYQDALTAMGREVASPAATAPTPEEGTP